MHTWHGMQGSPGPYTVASCSTASATAGPLALSTSLGASRSGDGSRLWRRSSCRTSSVATPRLRASGAVARFSTLSSPATATLTTKPSSCSFELADVATSTVDPRCRSDASNVEADQPEEPEAAHAASRT
eukprot:364197-Chlamydomonas_euryale.AAC.34